MSNTPSWLDAEAYIVSRHGFSGSEIHAHLRALCERAGACVSSDDLRIAVTRGHEMACEREGMPASADELEEMLERLAISVLIAHTCSEVKDGMDTDDAARVARQRAVQLGVSSDAINSTLGT